MKLSGSTRTKDALLTFMVILLTLEAAGSERPSEVAPGCFRKGHRVTCRAWRGPDAPDIPPNHLWSDFWVLDLSSTDAAKKVDMAARGPTCHAFVPESTSGLGSTLPDGRLPARWLGTRFRSIVVLYLRGAGLRGAHRDAFELVTFVQHVYLSSNRLQTLDPDMWHSNERLSGVTLENNLGLKIPEDGPLFRSDTIEYLDLSGCGLRSLSTDVFKELPKLQTLRLERNCLHAVPTEALAHLTDLWSLALGENVITGLQTADAQILALLPDGLLHGNPWRCDCALHDTLLQLDGTTKDFWDQAMADLVCLWPPEHMEKPWSEVLTSPSCRTYNATQDNATLPHAASTPSAPTTLLPTPAASEGCEGACSCSCGGGGDAAFCRWTLGGLFLLLALTVLAFAAAVFSGRVAASVALTDGRPRGGSAKRRAVSLSRAQLTADVADEGDGDDGDDGEEDSQRPGSGVRREEPWDVVTFGHGR